MSDLMLRDTHKGLADGIPFLFIFTTNTSEDISSVAVHVRAICKQIGNKQMKYRGKSVPSENFRSAGK
jgi:hypothetical protein